jgi:6-phosphogluconolactonase (cycloisomerase 2 family)
MSVAVAVDFKGKYLYVADTGAPSNVSVFAIGASGQITAAGSATGRDPLLLAMDPSEQYLYVVNRNTNKVDTFSVSARTGGLASVATGQTSRGMVVTN